MGVPKFYRWISERYPCLSEVVKEHQISEFDNLYLDMNGIIHVVSHPDDSNPHFRITEEKIFRDIFHYIDVLFRLIKPKKVFFMAVDGCAPRAKMNQQRGRRFRSAREAEELIAKAVSKGEVLPSEERFDSNCITPGTPFMVRLHEQLKYFVSDRVSNNVLWQGPRIYLSGHMTPGEGEHKIMDFIRSERAKPDHDPNTRHCLYGLDADLIMLGLVTHEPHFSLLREEVRFGGKEDKKRSTTPEDTTFHLLHLTVLREYIDFEFSSLRTSYLPFPYDLERIIDDWVLMGFLVGNDFIPHLPNLHIHHEGLPLLWSVYNKVLPTLDGYLNEDGKINLVRFEKFMAELAKFDFERFSEVYADLKWFAGKTGRRGVTSKASPERRKFNSRKAAELYRKTNRHELLDSLEESLAYDSDIDDDDEDDVSEARMTDAEHLLTNGTLPSETRDQLMVEEFAQHKRGYYIEKLVVECVTAPFLKDQALQYVRALQWILYYYYDGCPSWSWFFPFHYAPYISDIHSFSDVEITFSIGKPFLPFEQLMAVLPSASKKLLPLAYQSLMTDVLSPIMDFYPIRFETDLNGKQQEWEAVVLIPFIDERRLLAAMAAVQHLLTPEESSRNCHGPCLLFQHATELQQEFPSTLPGIFPDILANYARCTEIRMDEFLIPRVKLKRGLFEGVLLDVHFPGFPTFKHISHTSKLQKANVKVFQALSRGENMLVLPQPPAKEHAIEDVALELLGKTVFVRWPHLAEGRVEAVSNGFEKISLVRTKEVKDSADQWQRKKLNEYDRNKFLMDRDALIDVHLSRRGIVLDRVDILVYVQPLLGRRYICGSHGNITLDKQYSVQLEYHAHQTIVTNLRSHCPGFQQFTTMEELFPENSDVFMLGKVEYGAHGTVMGILEKGHVRVKFKINAEPDFSDIQYKQRSLSLQFLPSWMVAQKLSISSHLVSKITGCYRVANGQGEQTVNIGLNLKSNVKGEEVPGYTKKEDEQWVYSTKVVQVLDHYMKEWPNVFKVLMKKSESEITMEELFPEGCGKNIHDLTKYVKSLECCSIPRVSHGCLLVDEPVIAIIEHQLEAINSTSRKSQIMQVRPHLLYKPIVGNNVIADATTEYRLFDRVVSVKIGYSVPLGLRGTVIGIYPGERDMDTMYEVLFDEDFVDALKIRCSSNRAYRLNGVALINISHGERKARGEQKNSVKNKNNSNAWRKTPSYVNEGKRNENGKEFSEIWSDLKNFRSGKCHDEEHGSYSRCVTKEKFNAESLKKSDDTRVDKDYNGKMTVLGKHKPGSKARQKLPEQKSQNSVGSLNRAAAALASVKPDVPAESSHDAQFVALMNCLEVASKNDNPERKEPVTETKPVYGKKVSVEELFKVAQTDSHQNAFTAHRTTPVHELELWCKDHHLVPPRYEHTVDMDGKANPKYVCQVILNQLRFQSSYSKSKEQAEQSAAAVALSHLKKGSTGPRPTSAFRPVQPAKAPAQNTVVSVPINRSVQHMVLQHLQRGLPPWNSVIMNSRMVQPNLNFAVLAPMPMLPLQQQQTIPMSIAQPQRPIIPYSNQPPMSRPDPCSVSQCEPHGSNYSSTHGGVPYAQEPRPFNMSCPRAPAPPHIVEEPNKNQFVPLQVSRQQKTPQKVSSSTEREQSDKTKSKDESVDPKPKPTTKSAPTSKTNENVSKKTKKRSSHRLAANFSAAT